MAIKFTETEGQAKRNQLDYFKFKNGINKFRMVGDVLPRYVYWAKSADGQANLAIECLSFDREKEKFTNLEKDWYAHHFPNAKCSWAYVIQCIDESEGEPKLKVLALKKKLFGQIVDTAKKEQFGDPTSLETGWTCVVERKKTGAAAFNVEYTLDPFDSLETKGPVSDEIRALIEDPENGLKPIDTLLPRQTPEEQKAFIERTILSGPEDADNTDEEAMSDLNEDTKEVPFEEDVPQ